jgi:putative DNA primase/helicase
MRLSRTLNMDQDEVEEIAGTFAAICAIDAAIVEQAIRDLHTEIEGALRRQQDAPRHRQKEELGEEAAWQGPSIAESFKVQDDGVWYFPPTPPDQEPHPPIWVCAPLRIYGATIDVHHDNHGHALEFHDRHGFLQRWAMPLEFLEDKREYRRVLRRLGLRMTSSKQGIDLLHLYLEHCQADRQMWCVEKVGWHGHVYVLPDVTIGQESADEHFVLQGLTTANEGYRCRETLRAWQETVARLCVGNSRLVLAISMAFAAPLLTLLGHEGGGIHLRGPSSEGKTTTLLVGASVWGEPTRIESWRATCNGLEGVAALHNDNLLLLDELKEIDPREAGGAAYLLANGSGKRRGRPHGGTRPRLTWRTLFLSTGEISLAQHVEAAGLRVHAGQEVRLIDLPADAGESHGLFEDLHGHANGQVFADEMRERVQQAYGTAGRAFIAKVVEDIPYALTEVRDIIEGFMGQVPRTATGQVRRVATKFALIGAAGELAITWGITGWEEGIALAAAVRCYNDWLKQRGVLTNADEERALRQVRLFFEKFGESRFHPWEAGGPSSCQRCMGTGTHAGGECFACSGEGTTDSAPLDQRPVHDRAGFRRATTDDQVEFFTFPEVFEKEIAKGYAPAWLAKLLVQRGWIMPDPQGKSTRAERLPTIGNKRVYRFRPSILATDEPAGA